MNNGTVQKKRVVVTGFGLVTPVGNTTEDTWSAILAGKSGFSRTSQFISLDGLGVGGVCEVKDFDAKALLGRREARRRDRFQQIACVAANEALAQSGLQITDENRTRVGCFVGTGTGGIQSTIAAEHALQNGGARKVSPFAVPMIMPNGAAGLIAIDHGIQGPSLTTTTACAAGSDGVGQGFRAITHGWVDAAVVGGTEAPLTRMTVAGFSQAGALSVRSDGTPSPFDKDRDGLIPGEGTGMLVIESLEHAQARGATILGEIIGYGATTDAFHVTAPPEDGSGAGRAITAAITEAGITGADIDYINAHGTGTRLNDEAETKSIKLALGEDAYNIPISSTKSMTGHIMGGTGAIEAVFCLLAMRDSVVPPTINLVEFDPACDLTYIANEAKRDVNIDIATTHAFGFGGHNSVLVLKKFAG